MSWTLPDGNQSIISFPNLSTPIYYKGPFLSWWAVRSTKLDVWNITALKMANNILLTYGRKDFIYLFHIIAKLRIWHQLTTCLSDYNNVCKMVPQFITHLRTKIFHLMYKFPRPILSNTDNWSHANQKVWKC